MKLRGKKVVKGEINLPGDKSISHRAIIFSSLNSRSVEIENILLSRDVLSTIDCFRKLGIKIEIGKNKVTVYGKGKYGLKRPLEELYCGNSGTTMRLLAGLLSAQKFDSILTGDSSLSQRPMKRIIEPLSLMGARIESNNSKSPLIIKPSSKLKAINYEMPIASAQVKSAIILASTYLDEKARVIEKHKSRDHTELMIDFFENNHWKVDNLIIPGDISSASYFIALASLSKGSDLRIKDVGINPTRIGFIETLKKMGGKISIGNKRKINNEQVGDINIKYSPLKGISIDANMVPKLIDELPLLAVLASYGKGRTLVQGAQELRVKETDRIKELSRGLRKFGVDIKELEDGFIVMGKPEGGYRPAKVSSMGDHRLAMCFSIMASTIDGNSYIKDSQVVDVSYPDFFKHLNSFDLS